MGRIRLMTIGFLLMLIGIQFYCVQTYHVTPKVSKFIQDRLSEVDADADARKMRPANYFSTAYDNTFGYNPQNTIGSNDGFARELRPPSWLKWAALFAGAVVLLQGATLPKEAQS